MAEDANDDDDIYRWCCLTSAGSLLTNNYKVGIIKRREKNQTQTNEKGQLELYAKKHLTQVVRTWSKLHKQNCVSISMCRSLSGM